MTAPNLATIASITGKTIGSGSLTTDLATPILTCSANSVLKINSIMAANIDGVNSAAVTVGVYDSSEMAYYYIISAVPIAANTTVVILTRDSSIYLEEGDQIRAGASVADDASLIISYEELIA